MCNNSGYNYTIPRFNKMALKRKLY
jgi:hypothetical protein